MNKRTSLKDLSLSLDTLGLEAFMAYQWGSGFEASWVLRMGEDWVPTLPLEEGARKWRVKYRSSVQESLAWEFWANTVVLGMKEPWAQDVLRKQQFWFVPGIGQLSLGELVEMLEEHGFVPARSRKGLHKQCRKLRKRMIEKGAMLPAFEAEIEAPEGWRVLRTEEEFLQVGSTMQNCLWWSHWFDADRDTDRYLYHEVEGVLVHLGGEENCLLEAKKVGRVPADDELIVKELMKFLND